MMAGIKINNVIKKYKNITAVNEVSFDVESGQLFGLLGPNGAGKTTLVSMISTIVNPTSGEILIDGMNIKKHSKTIKQILGVVPQELALYETLNVIDNLSFFGKLYGSRGKDLNRRIDKILQIIGLENRAKDTIQTFSGGMKRRVNIGIGMIHNPKIMIFDEPTVGIDPQSRRYILETIKNLNEEGMTVIYTSHYMEEIEFLCEKIGIMDEGKLKCYGDKEKIKKDQGMDNVKVKSLDIGQEQINTLENIPGIIKVRTESDGISIDIEDISEQALDILNFFKSNNIELKNIEFRPTNLESVFLNLTGKKLRDN